MENLSWYKPVIYLGTVSMAFINLATSSLGMINPIETLTSVYNLYLVPSYLKELFLFKVLKNVNNIISNYLLLIQEIKVYVISLCTYSWQIIKFN